MRKLILLAYGPGDGLSELRREMENTGAYDAVCISYAGQKAQIRYPDATPTAVLRQTADSERVVLPLLMTQGTVYHTVRAQMDRIAQTRWIAPLLEDTQSVRQMADTLCDMLHPQPTEGYILLCHGSCKSDSSGYMRLQASLPENMRVILLHGSPNFEDAVIGLQDVQSLYVLPLLLIGGYHLKADILASDSPTMSALRKSGKPFFVRQTGLTGDPIFRTWLCRRAASFSAAK